jgi:regulatory protein
MVRLRLLKHRELSSAPGNGEDPRDSGEPAEFNAETQTVEVRRFALSFLATREYAAVELVVRLESRGVTRHLAERVVVQLAEEGLQSDERFTEVFVRSRLERGQGPMLLRAELRARGIDDSLIDRELDQTSAYWIDKAHAAALRHFKAAPRSREDWAAQARYLGRKGFTSEMIYAALGDQRD